MVGFPERSDEDQLTKIEKEKCDSREKISIDIKEKGETFDIRRASFENRLLR